MNVDAVRAEALRVISLIDDLLIKEIGGLVRDGNFKTSVHATVIGALRAKLYATVISMMEKSGVSSEEMGKMFLGIIEIEEAALKSVLGSRVIIKTDYGVTVVEKP